jgi:hypothetical protein
MAEDLTDFVLDYYSPFYDSDDSYELDELDTIISDSDDEIFEDEDDDNVDHIREYIEDNTPYNIDRRFNYIGYHYGVLGRWFGLIGNNIIYIRIRDGMNTFIYTSQVNNINDAERVFNEVPVCYHDAKIIFDALLEIINHDV